jgi:ribulose-5-phosphate 4-epimerase/fuculose-1-phosphate aldolase
MQRARLEVAQGSRILAMQGILDAFGHVSCRSPDRENRFLISRSMPPALVSHDDVLEVDLDGVAVSNPTARQFLERFLHAEIYRARPDVRAIVHSHAPAVLPFTVLPNARVRPICHMSGFLDKVSPPFNVSKAAGCPTDLLISNSVLGKSFAGHLAESAVGLMRAHGFTTVGRDIPHAVFRAIYTVRNCEVDLSARMLGVPEYLSSEEAQLCERTVGSQAERPWSLWINALEKHEAR